MGIQENIFEEFFETLEEDEGFPDSIVEKLKKLYENGVILSKEKLLEIVERGTKNDGED